MTNITFVEAPGQAPATLAFNFDSLPIRVVMIDGQPWFVALDVCKALGLKWKGSGSTGSLAALDEDERSMSSLSTPGGQQDLAIISESGLYILVLRCRDAVRTGTIPYRFRKWVTREVLPSIRRIGGYGVATIDPKALMLDGLRLPSAQIPAEVAIAMETKIWDMTREAHEIIKQHVVMMVAHCAEAGYPEKEIYIEPALETIKRSNLGSALAHTWVSKIRTLHGMVDTYLRIGNSLAEEMDALQNQGMAGH